MLSVPAFLAEKNRREGKNYIMLVELLYDDSDPNPANHAYFRAAQWDQDIVFAGNTYLAFPIGDVEVSQSVSGEIPAFDIPLINVGRELQSVLELYTLENKPGRLLWVHPDLTGDASAYIEEPFRVISAVATREDGRLSCASVTFDPTAVLLPAKLVTRDEYPGVNGFRSRFFV